MTEINPKLNSKYGCWVANNKIFNSKFDALRYASSVPGASVYFYYHDHVWANFDRSLLGKIPLTQLYKERAQQLRDKYDHLVLHYSGGSDSHNILHTFITNNIKLDEISVRWPKPLQDGKFYTPNTLDTSARNAASEWDFAIKPALKWIADNRPEIKITVAEYANDLTEQETSTKHLESRLLSMNTSRGGLAMLSMWTDVSLEANMVQQQNKNTAHIFGIDKPILVLKDGTVCMQFMDGVFETANPPNNRLEEKVEIFYWSPDFPILPMEQAYQTALYFKTRKEMHDLLGSSENLTQEQILKKFDEQGLLQKSIIYKDSWNNNTFQAGKPNLLRSDWYFWLYESNELSRLRTGWINAMKNLTEGVDKKFLLESNELDISLLKPIRTKPFPILKIF